MSLLISLLVSLLISLHLPPYPFPIPPLCSAPSERIGLGQVVGGHGASKTNLRGRKGSPRTRQPGGSVGDGGADDTGLRNDAAQIAARHETFGNRPCESDATLGE